MRSRIFQSTLLVTVLSLLLSAALFLSGAYGYYTARLESEQARQREMLSAGLASAGSDYLRHLEGTELRLYFFDENATLLFAQGGAARTAPAVYDWATQSAGDTIWARLRDAESGREYLAQTMTLSDGSLLYWETPEPGFRPLAVQTVAGYLFFLLLVMTAVCSLTARHVARVLTKPFDDARLEDLAVGDVCLELRPLAARMLDQNLQIQKQLQKQHGELKREYEKQDRTRRDFTANVSHELKTPLTSISGYAEILRDGLVRTEDIARFSGKIYDEAQRMIVLVGDILKLSQLDEGNQVPMKREKLDLYAICEQVIARLQSAAESKEISFTLDGEHSFITGVEQIVDEIVYNLCDNAIKYNRESGSVRVSVRREREKVVLTVADTGIGISPEEQDRVFERFYSVDKSHSKEIGGTGLGLSIVKHGALYHEARIELDSRLGEGTRFRVLFQELEQE